ncbi:MAG: HAD-IIB family hydrolase [Agriterribacter sp.]
MLLATDLDGTFLGGNEEERKKLYHLINKHTDITLVFVTGRGLHSVLSLFTGEFMIPVPGCFICDVGATILNGDTHEPVEPIQSNIEKKWPGRQNVLHVLKDVPGLILQDVPQERRCSFFFDKNIDREKLEQSVQLLNCDLIMSADKFADVMPGGVNKGNTLKQYIELLNYPAGEVLVAGDTFNDLSLFETGYKAIAVGNSEPGLISATKDKPNVYHAKNEGAGGILEAMKHFGFIS